MYFFTIVLQSRYSVLPIAFQPICWFSRLISRAWFHHATRSRDGCRALRRSALAGTGLFYELASGSINYRAFGSNAVYVLFFFLFFLFFSSPVHFFQTNKIDRVKIVDRCNVYGWKIRIETSLSLRLAQSFLFKV